MIPETCSDRIPLKSLCCEFCPTKAQIRTYLTVLCELRDINFRINVGPAQACQKPKIYTFNMAQGHMLLCLENKFIQLPLNIN